MTINKDINLETFSDLVSEKLGKKIIFSSIENVGGGYHSDGFKLTTLDGKQYFLKYVRSHDLGFEFPERQIMSLIVSNGMCQRAADKPKPVGVVVLNEEKGVILPEINENTKVYHLQEFAEIGESYSSLLAKKINKQHIDEEDKKQLSLIADELIKIHSVKHFSKDRERLNAIYNDGSRGLLISPELTMMVLSEFPNDYKILDLDGQKEVISLMFENAKAMMNRPERLCALHGDFWGTNIFFNDDKVSIIDFSRIPWGDPGIDVGWFICEFLWNYHLSGNEYFKELTEYWLDTYEQKSGDSEIRKNIALVMGWVGIVQIYPRWFPNVDLEMGKRFMDHIIKILKNKEFIWND